MQYTVGGNPKEKIGNFKNFGLVNMNMNSMTEVIWFAIIVHLITYLLYFDIITQTT